MSIVSVCRISKKSPLFIFNFLLPLPSNLKTLNNAIWAGMYDIEVEASSLVSSLSEMDRNRLKIVSKKQKNEKEIADSAAGAAAAARKQVLFSSLFNLLQGYTPT